MLRVGIEADPTLYLSFFPFWFQVTWDRQEGVQGTPRVGLWPARVCGPGGGPTSFLTSADDPLVGALPCS